MGDPSSQMMTAYPLRQPAAALVALAIAMTLTTRAEAATATFVGDRDNTLFEDPSGSLSNGAGEYAFVGKTVQGLSRRALVRFNLAGIPANATITAATVQLTVSQAQGAPEALTIHRVLAAWGEGTSDSGGSPTSGGGNGAPATATDATWLWRNYPSDAWATPGGDFNLAASATQSVDGPGVYAWSGTGLVQDVQFLLRNSSSNFGFLLKSGETVNGTAKRFNSRENSNATSRPVLIVEYDTAAMPAPLPWWSTLALAGLLGLIVARAKAQKTTSLTPP